MTLTHRQYEMAMLAAQALSDKEIAQRLGLDPRTVKCHMGMARKLTGARNRTELALMFVRGEVRGPSLMEAA